METFDIRYYDEAVIEHIATGTSDNHYVVRLEIQPGDSSAYFPEAKIVWARPLFANEKFVLPQIVVQRNSLEEDGQRVEYIPIWIGYEKVEEDDFYVYIQTRKRDYPYKITYTVTVYSSFQRDLEAFRYYLLSICPPRFVILGKDGSSWDALFETVNYEGELDVGGIRVLAFSFSFEVRALLTWDIRFRKEKFRKVEDYEVRIR